MNKVRAALCVVLVGWSCARPALAEVSTVSNDTLVVAFDDSSGRFSLARPGRAPFLSAGTLEGRFTKVEALPADDPVFGHGRRLLLHEQSGARWALELYPTLSFVLLRSQVSNAGKEAVTLQNAPIARFEMDLGKPAGSLRVQGTGGLTTPDQNPGSYLFLTLAEPETRNGVVAGWLTHDRGSGLLFSEVQEGRVQFRARVDYGQLRVPPGKTADLETLAIGFFEDARLGEEQFAAALARRYKIQLPPQLSGYCTWYSDQHGGAGDEKSILELARFANRELKPFGFSFIQIDDQWQDGILTNGPARGFDRVRPTGPYPGGMKPVAEGIQDLGLTAGIWFMPFARNFQDPEYRDRQEWFVRRTDGRPYDTSWGGASLDLTKPEVREHLRSLVRTIHGWGYNYFKMDGLWTGTATEQIYVNDGYKEDHMGNYRPFHDPSVTSVEMMRSGLKLIRDAVGPRVFLSGCNLSQNMRSLSGALGLVDSMRIGPDNGQHWADWRNEIAKNESGSLVTGPIRGTRLYFLHRRVWYNDPDPNYVRTSMPLEQARLIASWVGLSGQFNLNSDWIPALPAERLDILKRILPSHHAVARPVDYFDSPMPSMWLVTDDSVTPPRHVLGLFNWDSTARTIAGEALKAGLDPARTYQAFDFWTKAPLPSFQGRFQFDLPGTSCRVIAIRAASGHPQVLSTSRHVTQGITDLAAEVWDSGSRTLSGESALVAADPYELRIAGLQDGGQVWNATDIELSEAAQSTGVSAKLSREGENLRLILSSPLSQTVRWKIRF
jgi:hypothetical protein